jgi:hypothetical protein
VSEKRRSHSRRLKNGSTAAPNASKQGATHKRMSWQGMEGRLPFTNERTAKARKADTNMGKWLVIILATVCALGILTHFMGHHSLASTAVTVPGTEHTPAFGLTWFVIGGLVLGGLFYKLIKK